MACILLGVAVWLGLDLLMDRLGFNPRGGLSALIHGLIVVPIIMWPFWFRLKKSCTGEPSP